MKKNKIYLKAAKSITNKQNFYSCSAIEQFSTDHKYDINSTLNKYQILFGHNKNVINGWWSKSFIREDNSLCRSLALLFAYEMGL